MPDSLSLLQNVTAKQVSTTPFPYVVIKNALPQALCDELIRTYPGYDLMGVDTAANNKRWDYSARQVAGDDRVAGLWRDFVAYHSSQEFLDEIMSLFGDAIHALYPHQFPSRVSLRALRAGVREVHDFDECDILMDAQISGNTPVQEASSVRGTHVDAGSKLYSALYYLRDENDDSRGGDLTISRFKPHLSRVRDKLRCFEGVYVNDAYIDVIETVPYANNTLVLFINSIDSLHGVTVREPTERSRRFLNMVGTLPVELYSTKTKIERLLPKPMRKAYRQWRRPAVR